MANSIQDIKKRLAHWNVLLDEDKKGDLLEAFEESPLPDTAGFLSGLDISDCVSFFLLLDREMQSSLFAYFDIEKQLEIYHMMPIRVFVSMFEKIFSDVRADFYLALNEKQRSQLLPFLSKKVRKDVLLLSGYPPERAGGIMHTDFVIVHSDMTVAEAIAKVRQEAPSKKMLYYLYVVDENMKLANVVDLKELIVAESHKKIEELLEEKNLVFVRLQEDREVVARKIEKYDLMAIPVLNEEDQIVGIVSYDDAFDVLRAAEKEDLEKFMGITPDEREKSYLRTSSWKHLRQRINWVSGLFILSAIATIVLHEHVETFRQFPFVAIYLSTISDTGGNVGSQAATMIIRAMSLGQVSLKNWATIVYKELKISLMMAIAIFFFCLVKSWVIFYILFPNPVQTVSLPLMIFVVSLVMASQVIISTLIGACLPLFMKWLGKDPALAASPAITTIVDIIGVSIYLAVMLLILPDP